MCGLHLFAEEAGDIWHTSCLACPATQVLKFAQDLGLEELEVEGVSCLGAAMSFSNCEWSLPLGIGPACNIGCFASCFSGLHGADSCMPRESAAPNTLHPAAQAAAAQGQT